jgi:hypothetical protein
MCTANASTAVVQLAHSQLSLLQHRSLQMPQRLRDEFSGKSTADHNSGSSAMVFVKGDANYRRLLGDRTWPLDTPFSDVVSYFPVPVCALRTLKAEVS